MFVRQQDARFCLAVPSCLPVPPPALRECSRPNAEQRTQRARFACSAPPHYRAVSDAYNQSLAPISTRGRTAQCP